MNGQKVTSFAGGYIKKQEALRIIRESIIGELEQ
jgi:hypothetical protein